LSITPGSTATVNHPTAVTYASVVEKSIAVNVTQVNAAADGDNTNNDGAAKINTVSQLSPKKVIIEEGTGTWCGWCPRGAVAMEYMDENHADGFIGVAVHNGDPMTVTEYDNGANFSGFPGANVDRVLLGQDVSDQDFEAYYNARKDLVVPAALTGTFSISGSTVTIPVTATFRTVFANADLRLGVIISEDHVTGTASTYAQTNYYSSASQNIALTGAGHDWQASPNPVPAAQMEYNHVGRALLGGYDGQTGTVPTTITDGQVVNYTFSYTVPATSTRAHMHAVIVLIDQATGEIVNAEKVELTSAGVEEAETLNMEVYPNPANDVVNVKFDGKGLTYTVTVTDLAGRQVQSTVVANATGAQSVALPLNGLAKGNYLVTVARDGASYTQNLVIK